MNIKTMNYDELSEHVTEAIAELRRKAYGEGYEQGKFDATMDSAIEKYDGALRKLADESPQAKRDRIVEQAKKDVEELTGESGVFRATLEGYKNQAAQARFVINKKKRTAVALIIGYYSKNVYERGIAKAHPNDCFNVHIGKAISLRRALGLEVPVEYLNAPQPTRVRKGDIVESTIHGKDHIFKVEVGSGEKPIAGKPHADAIYVKRAKIIDDSRE